MPNPLDPIWDAHATTRAALKVVKRCEYCDRNRMDDVADLFVSAVGQVLIAQVGNIRKYRHWLAHGRRWAQPPTVTPAFAYRALTAFLQSVGLV